MFIGLALLHFFKLLVFIGTPGLMIIFFLVAINRVKNKAITTKTALRIGLISALKALVTMFFICIIVVCLSFMIFHDLD